MAHAPGEAPSPDVLLLPAMNCELSTLFMFKYLRREYFENLYNKSRTALQCAFFLSSDLLACIYGARSGSEENLIWVDLTMDIH